LGKAAPARVVDIQVSILEEEYGFAERYYFNTFLFTTRVVMVLGYLVGSSDTALSW
jgi:hypothetical protein